MAYVLKFGSYQLPSVFGVVSDPQEASIAMIKTPRYDGDSASTRYLKGKTIEVDGALAETMGTYTETGIRSLMDTLKANLQGKQNFYEFDDRYYRNTQLLSMHINNSPGLSLRFRTVKLTFQTPDPYLYSDTLTTTARSISASGQTLNVTTGGNADAYPVISLTVGGSGAKTLAATITNSTTGASFTLAGSCNGGDVIVVDCLNKTVVIGSTSRIDMFDDGTAPGFFSMANGVNTITVAYTTATITNLSVAHRSRWY